MYGLRAILHVTLCNDRVCARSASGPASTVGHVFKALRALRLLRLFKLLKLNAMFDRIEEAFSINHHVLRLVKLLIVAIMSMHFGACIWFAIGDSTLDTGDGWMNHAGAVWSDPSTGVATTSDQYVASYYYIITTLATVGAQAHLQLARLVAPGACAQRSSVWLQGTATWCQ